MLSVLRSGDRVEMDGLHTELALGLIGQLQTAPFVAKTYQMVCEPRTDALIRWGGENNSFVVADVAGFSQLLLPCFFKHGNNRQRPRAAARGVGQ